MEIDFWSSSVYSAKHLSADQPSRHNSDDHLIMDESEGDDDIEACFPCPFCYLDIEVHLICSHLQVCLSCEANLGKDAVEHLIVQHASSLKHRKKSQKSGFWNGSSTMLDKELSSFLGSSTIGRENARECIPDLLLSPVFCPAPLSEPKGIRKDDCSNEVTVASDLKSMVSTLLDNGHEENIEEKRQRAAFVQQLIMSTVFQDSDLMLLQKDAKGCVAF